VIPSRVRSFSLRLMSLSVALASLASCEFAVAEVRDKAVVSLTFDDLPDAAATTTADSAKTGKVADAVTLTQAPSRIPSAFVAANAGDPCC
jgi:hypothetical protein